LDAAAWKQTRTEAGGGAATPNKRKAQGLAGAPPDKDGLTTVRRSSARPASLWLTIGCRELVLELSLQMLDDLWIALHGAEWMTD
jgi:hypothetical protein